MHVDTEERCYIRSLLFSQIIIDTYVSVLCSLSVFVLVLSILMVLTKMVAFFTSRFTQKNILRVYPKGTRVTSSNYRAHIGWMYGAQMVAFNMQVRDLRSSLFSNKRFILVFTIFQLFCVMHF